MERSAKKRRICRNEGIAGSPSRTHISTEGHKMVTPSGHEYEVFLSFRGPDNQSGFTNSLYTSLNDAGILTFKDNEELRVGEEFVPELLQAINQSKILIPIFSKGYASSAWCLKKLVRMVECQKTGSQKIMPIFFDVAPSEVRHQNGDFGAALLAHENKSRYGDDTINEWKATLSAVGEMSGWDLHCQSPRREGEFAKQFTEEVFRELKKAYLIVSDHLVNVDITTFNITNFSVEEVIILNLSHSKITGDWNGWSHVEVMKNLKSLDLSECQNLRRLPNKLGSNLASLEYLSLRGCTSLEMLPDTLGDLKSLIELDISNSGIIELSDSIGKLKNLKVVKMKGISTMKIPPAFGTIEKLEKIEICKKYGSTDKLHVRIGDGIYSRIYRKQFLRIFSLTGASIYELPPRLPESLIELRLGTLRTDMFPNLSNLINLKELSLTFSRPDNSKSEQYGFVGDPMPRLIGNLSKLESLSLSFCCETAPPTDISLPPQLKSLRLSCPILRCLPKLPSSLSSLQLYCHGSLFSSMEDVSNLKNLSSLKIFGSKITEIRGLGCLENLEELDLSSLKELQILPDLSNLNNLRSLQVSGCDNLVEIQGKLPRCLDRWHIRSCPSLQNLPDLSSMVGEQQPVIFLCPKLKEEAILGFALNNRPDLVLDGHDKLRLLPDLSESNKLRRLKVSSCHNLVEIQGELPQSLEELEISYCISLQRLPVLLNLKKLRSVKISYCRKLNVEAIFGFARTNPLNLQLQILPDLSNSDESGRLRGDNCSNLVEVQADVPESLEELHISFNEALCKLPDLSNLMGLREVCIRSCANLVEIQGKLPESLEILTISLCESLLKLPDLSCLKKLRRVNIRGCTKLEGEAILGSSRRSLVNLWENLQYLRICGLRQLEILLDLSKLNKLRHLRVEKCSNLLEIQGKLPESLKKLEILSCESLQKVPDLSSLKGLRRLRINRCSKLNVEVNSWLSSEKLVKFVVEFRI